MPKLSYCILSFNRKDKLFNLLEQLNKTKIPDSEIIVVDNGSTDGTKEMLSQFNNNYTKVILNSENMGVSKGWNILIKASQSPLPCIFNDDYFINFSGWEKFYLDTFDKQVGIMSFPRCISRPLGPEVYDNFILENTCKYTHNFRLMCIPRQIFDKIGYFDEEFFLGYEDTDFNMRALKSGFPLLEMNLDKVYISHLKDTNCVKNKYDLAQDEIHRNNFGKNNNHFYKKWPHGL